MGAYLSVATEDLKAFHTIDRELYTILVTQLGREPSQAARAMAFWLWLEYTGNESVIFTLRSSPNNVVKSAYEEAIACMACMGSENPPTPSYIQLPITLGIIKNHNFCLHFLDENRQSALESIANIHASVCAKVFDDIEVGLGQGDATPTLNPNAAPYFPCGDKSPTIKSNFEVGESSNAGSGGAVDDRSMFMTFSRRYPVSVAELRNYLTRNYGEVEEIEVQSVPPRKQTIYARVVFRSARTVNKILKGQTRVWFKVHGKQVWARRYISRN